MKRDGKKRSVQHGELKPKKRSVQHGELKPKKRSVQHGELKPQTDGERAQRERDFSIRWLNPWMLETPRLNDAVYGMVANDSGIDSLTESVKRHGLLAPVAVNRQGVIISGNRRTMAACRAGLREVPCYVWDVEQHSDDFARLLVEANENRVKGVAAQMAEIGLKGAADKPAVWLEMQRIKAERRERYGGIAAALNVTERKRKGITRARKLADAVIEAVNSQRAEGITPTVRQIHYVLLNMHPIKDTQTGERYANDTASYDALVRVAARLRVNGEIPFSWICDAGRELYAPQTHVDAVEYAEMWLRWFGGDYRRNMMRSQSAFFAVAVEKEAMGEFFRRHMAAKYPGAPVMVCKGYASLSLAHELAVAFEQSGKERMVILAFSDCDPAGRGIVEDIGAKMLELEISQENLTLAPCGLTHEQARAHGARPQPIKAKGKGGETIARRFEREHGTLDVYELEAIPPKELLKILDEEMQRRMDVEAYNAEIEREREDARTLADTQRRLYDALKPRT